MSYRNARKGPRPWRRELEDTVSRVRLGGLFYLAGWLIVGVADGAAQDYPVPFALTLLAFLSLALLRLRAVPAVAEAAQAQRHIVLRWSVVLATNVLWSGALVWLLATSASIEARLLAIVLTGAYATAVAHALPMRASFATSALLILFVPMLAMLAATPGQRLLAAALAVYLLYILLAMRRAHSEYWQRVELEDDIRRERDFYEQQSRRDALTGLANRRRFDSAFASLVSAGRSPPAVVSLILFDLDRFKTINDRHGHGAGDDCLVAFARLLGQAFAGAGELPARLGGEEFAVLLPDVTLEQALARAEAVRHALAAAPVQAVDGCVTPTVSGGVVCRVGSEDVEAMMKRADAALYEAKRAGRNRVVACHGAPAAAGGAVLSAAGAIDVPDGTGADRGPPGGLPLAPDPVH
jgi:diguanylate cyclase (GGDEF)-like protein